MEDGVGEDFDAISKRRGRDEEDDGDLDSDCDDWDSLFDEPMDAQQEGPCCILEFDSSVAVTMHPISTRLSQVNVKPTAAARVAASRIAPPIPGLYFDPSIRLPDELERNLLEMCMRTYFCSEDINQVMLFERAQGPDTSAPTAGNNVVSGGLPGFLQDVLRCLSELLKDHLPADVHALLFPSLGSSSSPRQAILNLYRPGEGISAHVDLLRRFGDGIVGLSLRSGCVMCFERVCEEERGSRGASQEGRTTDNGQSQVSQLRSLMNVESGCCCESYFERAKVPADTSLSAHNLYLPTGTIIVLTGDARYRWTHAIEPATVDLVESSHKPLGEETREAERISRGTRLSITFRWLLPGADIVGGSS